MENKNYLLIGNNYYPAKEICNEERGEGTQNKVWYNILFGGEERSALFKEGNLIGDIITYTVAEKIKFPCCRAVAAKKGSKTGILSFNELKQGQSLCEAVIIAEKYFADSEEYELYKKTGTISFDFAIKIIEKETEDVLKEKYRSTNIESANLSEIITYQKNKNIYKFIQIVVLGCILFNTDLNMENWAFVLGTEGTIEIYNAFDNCNCLGLDWDDDILKDCFELEGDINSLLRDSFHSKISPPVGKEGFKKSSHIDLLRYLLLESKYADITFDVLNIFFQKFKCTNDLIEIFTNCHLSKEHLKFSKTVLDYLYLQITVIINKYREQQHDLQ